MSLDHEEQEWRAFQQEARPAVAALEALAGRFSSETLRLYLNEVRENILSLLDADDARDAA
ncbi:MAG TPA: hypothetical protein VGE52_02420 [Pirellulales bacterium]